MNRINWAFLIAVVFCLAIWGTLAWLTYDAIA
jgi:hypothetical protein